MTVRVLKPQIKHPNEEPTEEEMVKLTGMIMQLFEHWQLNEQTQLELLDLSPKSRSSINKYKNNKTTLPKNRDSLDRIGYLLAIHKSLRLLYPSNKEIVYSWISRKNTAFNNYTPLEIIQNEGIIGLDKVSRYLEFIQSN